MPPPEAVQDSTYDAVTLADDQPSPDPYQWPSPPKSRSKAGMLPWLDWKFSAILPVALVLLLATALWQITRSEDLIGFTVTDSSSGEPIAGAHVAFENEIYAAGSDGVVTISRPEESVAVRVSADGYIPMSGEVTNETSHAQAVQLRPSTLIGRLTDKETGEPIVAADIAILAPDGSVVSSTQTDESGTYRLTDVPEGASVQVEAGSYGSFSQGVDGKTELNISIALESASGVVMNDSGEPLQGAIARAGDATAVSAGDGTFSIEGVVDGTDITITAPGFETVVATVANGQVADVEMSPMQIRAVYANWSIMGTPGGLDDLIEIANTTEINAIVIDVKQDTVYFDSQVPFFVEAGTVSPVYDIDEVLAKLKDNDIYTIARVVVFQDPLVAEARPELAVHDINGGLWVNEMGVAWVNAFKEELWDANIDLAVEVIEHGFDEVQYDYVRFPSDGDLSTADFGQEYTAESREAAITAFVKQSHEAINAAGGLLGADLFGFITIVDDEQYIGQRFSSLEPHLDFVCMMIYPSHFETGNIASAAGHPNDYPYETIFESLERAEQIVPGSSAKFRPWLQDFSYGFNGLRDYTAADVRAQIDAAEEFGASGWMLWGDPFNVTVDALNPEPGN
jgi:hypothetical protein